MRSSKAKAPRQSLDKSELVGQLISFEVFLRERPVTRYGQTDAVMVDLSVLSGSRSGQRFPFWRVMGALARQMSELPMGVRHCARVIRGTTKAGHTWYGIEPATDPADLALAAQIEEWRERLEQVEVEE